MDFALDWMAGAAAEALYWPPVRLEVDSAWYGHVPFAHWLVCAARPRVVVELGTHAGVSFTAFCEAARRCLLPTRLVAVDTWQGDKHAGFYSDRVYKDLLAFVAARYEPQARLLRMTFAEALAEVPDGTVDLLHVDGRHRYEDVREDYESWRCKLSPRAVVLFHDVAERREDFGVFRYWEELGRTAPHFTFTHAHGLGVLLPGPDAPEAVAALCALRLTGAAPALRERFAFHGERWVAQARLDRAEQAVTALQGHIGSLEQWIATLRGEEAA